MRVLRWTEWYWNGFHSAFCSYHSTSSPLHIHSYIIATIIIIIIIHSVDKLTTQNKHGLLYPVFFLFEMTKADGIMALCRCCFLVAFRAIMIEAVTVVTRRQQSLGLEGGFQAQRANSYLINIIPMFRSIRTLTSL